LQTYRAHTCILQVDITPNVSFDTIAREWRCKWSADTDKAALVSAQNELAAIVDEVCWKLIKMIILSCWLFGMLAFFPFK